jgi:sterol desaturase/sphingolipid hydroxylase (fatty acid hydroxylase superfamily)
MAEHLDPSLVAIPFYVATMLWEGYATRRRNAAGEGLVGYERRDTVASLGTGLVSVLTVGLQGLGVERLAAWCFDHRVVSLGDGPLRWFIAMLAWDFQYYWLHRWEHGVRLLWATHVSHHSSEHYNLSTALRQPWAPFLGLAMFPPLGFLGLAPWEIMTCGGFNLIYQFWIHTEAIDRLPAPLEFVLNTPSHHRVHHGSNPQYLDKNHGGILILWDRLFGTFEPEADPVRYGLVKNVKSFNLFTIFAHEFIAIAKDAWHAKSWGERLRYVFGDPGWKPDVEGAREGSPAE